MNINNDKILSSTGLSFNNEMDMLHYIISDLQYLIAHNKNYTKSQYNRICDLYEILNAVEPSEEDHLSAE